MPTNTTNQGIPLPLGPDPADGPTAFANQTAVIETRLAMRFTDAADRTTRVPVPIEGMVSHLGTENRLEVYDGTNWVSVLTRALFAYVRKSANQSLASNTVLQNDNTLLVTLPTAGVFGFSVEVFYDGPDAADIKFAFTAPAGATGTYGIQAISTAGAGGVGTGIWSATTTFGTALTAGSTGVGNGLLAKLEGEITMGGTGGNLQLQWAQSTSDAGNTTVRARSRMRVWRSA